MTNSIQNKPVYHSNTHEKATAFKGYVDSESRSLGRSFSPQSQGIWEGIGRIQDSQEIGATLFFGRNWQTERPDAVPVVLLSSKGIQPELERAMASLFSTRQVFAVTYEPPENPPSDLLLRAMDWVRNVTESEKVDVIIHNAEKSPGAILDRLNPYQSGIRNVTQVGYNPLQLTWNQQRTESQGDNKPSVDIGGDPIFFRMSKRFLRASANLFSRLSQAG